MASACFILDRDVRLVASTGEKTSGGWRMSSFLTPRKITTTEESAMSFADRVKLLKADKQNPNGLANWVPEGTIKVVADNLVDPPEISTLSLHLPAVPADIVGELEEVHVTSSDENLLVLSTGPASFRLASSGRYLVYDVTAGSGDLFLAPPIDTFEVKEVFGCRPVIVRHGGGGGFVMAIVVWSNRARKYSLLRWSSPSSSQGSNNNDDDQGQQQQWVWSDVCLPDDMAHYPFRADVAFAFQGRLACWVDLYLGIRTCDLLSPDPPRTTWCGDVAAGQMDTALDCAVDSDRTVDECERPPAGFVDSVVHDCKPRTSSPFPPEKRSRFDSLTDVSLARGRSWSGAGSIARSRRFRTVGPACQSSPPQQYPGIRRLTLFAATPTARNPVRSRSGLEFQTPGSFLTPMPRSRSAPIQYGHRPALIVLYDRRRGAGRPQELLLLALRPPERLAPHRGAAAIRLRRRRMSGAADGCGSRRVAPPCLVAWRRGWEWERVGLLQEAAWCGGQVVSGSPGADGRQTRTGRWKGLPPPPLSLTDSWTLAQVRAVQRRTAPFFLAHTPRLPLPVYIQRRLEAPSATSQNPSARALCAAVAGVELSAACSLDAVKLVEPLPASLIPADSMATLIAEGNRRPHELPRTNSHSPGRFPNTAISTREALPVGHPPRFDSSLCSHEGLTLDETDPFHPSMPPIDCQNATAAWSSEAPPPLFDSGRSRPSPRLPTESPASRAP
ncbi:hypothetical protein HU200_038195 [Digitaria exilis]|uniref:DUF1618 domain-containing protein n=1 Tax=Digitaria exilis TaxID=1010633 RepID=A0A835EIK8_9POAL|nr:hypothetical protein HU200_038195 [Digitaria exilis]